MKAAITIEHEEASLSLPLDWLCRLCLEFFFPFLREYLRR
jgi:hypothetical protein